MKKSEEFSDAELKLLIEQAARPLANDRFEEQMMALVHKESAYKKEVAAQLKISFRFFLGALAGGLTLLLIVLLGRLLPTYPVITLATFLLFAFAVAGVMCFANYRRLISDYL